MNNRALFRSSRDQGFAFVELLFGRRIKQWATRKSPHLLTLSVTGLALIVVSSELACAEYTFKIVADNTTAAPSGQFSSFFSDPSISNGAVAFEGLFNNGSGTNKGIFIGNGGLPKTIAKTGDSVLAGKFSDFGLRSPAISNGTAAFLGTYIDGQTAREGIFTGSGGSLSPIAKSGDSAPAGTSGGSFSIFDEPSFSGTTVAFNGSYNSNGSASGGEGVFTTTNGITSTATTSNADSPARLYTSLSASAVSGSTAAFFGVFQGTDGFGQGIFKDSGVSPTVIIVKNGDPAPTGTFSGFWQAPSISNSTVAFVASYTNGGQGVFNGNGGPPVTIAKKGDVFEGNTFATFGTMASISGSTTAFVGSNTSGNAGIYISSSGSLTSVVRPRQALFGSTVLGLNLGESALDPDGSGRIAFSYVLSDNRRGIAIATPSPAVPAGPKTYAILVGSDAPAKDSSGVLQQDAIRGNLDVDHVAAQLATWSTNHHALNPSVTTLKYYWNTSSNFSSDIQNAISNVASQVKPGDTLLFYYSGHGEEGQASQDYLHPTANVLYQDDSLAAALSDPRLADVNKLVMIDACHALGFWSNDAPGDKDLETLSNISFIGASAKDQIARSLPADLLSVGPQWQKGTGWFTDLMLDDLIPENTMADLARIANLFPNSHGYSKDDGYSEGSQLAVLAASSDFDSRLKLDGTMVGDYDRDGDVDSDDLLVLRRSFGSTVTLSADGNHDGAVNTADYVMWRKSVRSSGVGSNVGAIPEPASFSLAIAAILGLVDCRRARASRHFIT